MARKSKVSTKGEAAISKIPEETKITVTVLLDGEVLDWLKSKGEGHLTRINDILLTFMEAERPAGAR